MLKKLPNLKYDKKFLINMYMALLKEVNFFLRINS